VRGALANADCGVVTVAAGIGGLAVVKRHDHRFPHISGMAGVAQFASHWMSGGFIRVATDTLMAAGGVTRLPGHSVVIKEDLRPVGGVMAGIAGLAYGNVASAFPQCDRTVMAVFTGIGGLGVIYGNCKRSPARTGGMTKLTSI